MNTLDELLSKRSHVFVSGVDHSGTSLVVRLLKTCGWRDRTDFSNDIEHEEDIEFRTINDGLLFRKSYIEDPLQHMVSLWESVRTAGYPIVLKDPRFLFTLPLWGTLPGVYDQTFVLVERNPQRVKASHLRRGEEPVCRYPPLWRAPIETYQAWARHIYAWWPGAKLFITDDMIAKCFQLIDIDRLLTD